MTVGEERTRLSAKFKANADGRKWSFNNFTKVNIKNKLN